MIYLGYAITQLVFAATMFCGYCLTKSNWWWWMVALMASLEFKKRG